MSFTIEVIEEVNHNIFEWLFVAVLFKELSLDALLRNAGLVFRRDILCDPPYCLVRSRIDYTSIM